MHGGRAVGVILVWVLLLAFVRLVVAPPQTCPPLTNDQARVAAAEAVGWFQRNLQPDGTFRYEVELETGADRGGYNAARHAGAMLSLYQAARAGVPGALQTGDAARGWALANLVPAAGGVTLAPPGEAFSTGPAALLAAALSERRLATGDPADDATLQALGAFLAANVAGPPAAGDEDPPPPGLVAGRYDPATGPAFDEPSPYYTGETFLALARLHSAFPDRGYDEVTRRVAAYVTERDDVERYWPGVPDHWSAYAFAEMAMSWPGGGADLTTAQTDYLRRQAGLAAAITRWESQRTGELPTTLTRGPEVRGAGIGTTGELQANLFRVAGAEAALADLRGGIAANTRCITGIIAARQLTSTDAQAQSLQPPLVQGAWFEKGVTRMDDQQHPLSALLLSYPNVEGVPLAGRELNVWLALVALVALWNPGYVAAGVPAGPRGRRVLYTAVGCVLGTAALVALAAAGDRVLDWLDITAPTAWIAAGVVVLMGAVSAWRGPQRVVGGVDALIPVGAAPGMGPMGRPVSGPAGLPWPTVASRAAPPPEPVIEGKVAIVPILWPLVLRPTLAVVALSFGVSPGPVQVGVACGLAALATVLLVAFHPDRPGEPWWNHWARNLGCAVAVLAGIAVLVDGVFGV